MSWHFSRALVAAYSGGSSSDGAPFVVSKSTLSRAQSLRHDKMTDASTLSRYGMTCEPLTESRGEELLMSFRAAFHAKTSLAREPISDWTASEAGYGVSIFGSLAKFDPVSYSWKTRQGLLFEDSTESLEIWPRWGMVLNGECYPLPSAEHHTAEKESGFWPTPCKTDNWPVALDTMQRKDRGDTRPSGAKIGFCLKWHRPCVERWTLDGIIFPTLHELLMMWPVGWTDLRPLETAKFQQWLNSHGKSSD